MPLPSPAPTFDDPIELLVACHDKVRRFTDLMERLHTHVAAAGADREAADAARAILRYFDLAAPLHHADEDEDLYPALRSLGRAALDAALDEISAEHARLDHRWQALRPWLQAVSQGRATDTHTDVSGFAQAYRVHAAREEAEIYPQARALSPDRLSALGRSMASRRQVP